MATTITRRPLPALVSLLALLVLTALVWWRVIDRDSGTGAKAGPKTTPTPCPTAPAATATTTLGAPGTVTVRVLNSTSRQGIAGKARTTLLAAGFKIPDAAGNDSPSVSITATAQIRYGAAGVDGARLLHYYFPGATLTLEKATHSAIVTVSLGDAYKMVASAEQVRAALAAQRVALAPTAKGTATKAGTGTAAARPSGSSPAGSASPTC